MNGRIATLDAVRGFAVMGILLLNIVDFGMPDYAYVDPNHYGGAHGADGWSWAIVYVLADGKMRGLFTMMFGASTVLIAERAVASGHSAVCVHQARMASLFMIGMIHAYLIWAGDILVLYALCGAVIFVVWQWRPRALLAIGIALLGFQLVTGLISFAALSTLQARAALPDATAATQAEWREVQRAAVPAPGAASADLRAHRGSWRDAARARVAAAVEVQTEINPQLVPDTLALMAIGMALFRTGFFSGSWPRRRYRRCVATGVLIVMPLYVPLVIWIERTQFSPVTLVATDAIQLVLLRPWLAMAWASMIILFVQSGSAAWLAVRLSATGRMAFSNYLATSMVCTLIFDGHGLGWYGYLSRWQLYPVVAALWAVMLIWSKAWLDRFHHGPMEWVWRSMARGQWQPMRLTPHPPS